MTDGRIDRRNGLAVFEALWIYLEAMRPFLYGKMPVHAGTADQASQMKRALPPEMQPEFDKMLVDNTSGPLLPLDVKHIPHIVKDCWNPVFHRYFDDDDTNIKKMHYLAKVRNLVCHPGLGELDDRQAHRAFSASAKLLRLIDRHDAAEEIEMVQCSLNDDARAEASQISLETVEQVRADFEADMQGMKSQLDALSAELAVLRENSRRARRGSTIRSAIRKVLPRLKIRFSFAFGEEPPPSIKSPLHRPPDEVMPDFDLPKPMESKRRSEVAHPEAEPDNGHSSSEAGPNVIKFARG